MTADAVFLVWLVAAGVFGGLGWWIATQRRRSPWEGFALGALFGPLGAVIEALMPEGEPTVYRKPTPTTPATPDSDALTPAHLMAIAIFVIALVALALSNISSHG
jgi:hypothetical protein